MIYFFLMLTITSGLCVLAGFVEWLLDYFGVWSK